MVIIDNIKNFDLKSTITCGQIFRYKCLYDNTYIVLLSDRVIKIKQDENKLYVTSNNEINLEKIIKIYFDLDRDYEKINRYIINREPKLRKVVENNKGLKMIKQEPFETVMEYIISSNNRVPAIANAMNNLAMEYGKEIEFDGDKYYLFPKAKDLKNVTIEDYRNAKVGFRDKYLFNIVKAINSNELNLEDIYNINTKEAMEKLMSYNGIGVKVASCILLFAYSKFDVFPIDTWVKKYMKDIYNIQDIKTIETLAKEKYGKYSGIVLQYMFNIKRNK